MRLTCTMHFRFVYCHFYLKPLCLQRTARNSLASISSLIGKFMLDGMDAFDVPFDFAGLRAHSRMNRVLFETWRSLPGKATRFFSDD